MRYKTSYYNITVKKRNKEKVIYNTRTGAIATISEIDVKEFEHAMQFPNSSSGAIFSFLTENYFLVDENLCEKELVYNSYQQYTTQSEIIKVTVLPTEGCNFACPYCFTYKKTDKFMKPETYERIYRLLKKKVLEGAKSLKINWFGGEPTICTKDIINFMRGIKKDFKRKSISLSSSMVTNGYLLTPENFSNLFESGVTSFQITLDGDAENHDKFRYLRGKQGTFSKIYNNVLMIKKNFPEKQFSIYIRGNFTNESLGNMRNLIMMFKNDFGEDNRFCLYFRPVYEFETNDNEIKNMDSKICTIDEGIGIQNLLASEVKESLNKDFNIRIVDPLPQPSFAWCDSMLKNSIIIGPDGTLYPCDTYIGMVSESIGFLDSNGEINYNKNYQQWHRSIYDENNVECLKCKLLPICQGGCQRVRLKENNRNCFWTVESIKETMRNL
ncbi:MAG: radical SAM protein [bacterium]